MSKLHIKKGDTVYVNSGEDKGKTGRVLKVLVKEGRALVEGINMVSKSTKPNAKNPQGGIVKQEAAIHISNLNVVDPKTGKPTRVGRKESSDGRTFVLKQARLCFCVSRFAAVGSDVENGTTEKKLSISIRLQKRRQRERQIFYGHCRQKRRRTAFRFFGKQKIRQGGGAQQAAPTFKGVLQAAFPLHTGGICLCRHTACARGGFFRNKKKPDGAFQKT